MLLFWNINFICSLVFTAHGKRPTNRGPFWNFWQICYIVRERGKACSSCPCVLDTKLNAIFFLFFMMVFPYTCIIFTSSFPFSLDCRRYLAFVNFVRRLRWTECMTWEQSNQFQWEYMTIINLVSLISWLISTVKAHLGDFNIRNSPCFALFFITADSCTEFYSPNPRSALLAGICDEGYCRCSQGILYKEKFNNHYFAFV